MLFRGNSDRAKKGRKSAERKIFSPLLCQLSYLFFGARFVFGSGLSGIARIDILEPKLLAVGDAVRGYKLLGSFDDFVSFHCPPCGYGSLATVL